MRWLAGPPRAHRPGALDQIAEWWQHVEKGRRHTESPQTPTQRAFVRATAGAPHMRVMP
ncbi:MAG: hypothetical protein OXC06_18635 [Acidimicrobiaceae bacterium]|nr:hypothetical protein [Acidimicrobiaceae bacterium]